MIDLRKFNIVLVEPEIPQNTGNIARTCAATGASLYLIKPLGFEIDDKKLKRAGLDYWDKLDIHYEESLDDFLSHHKGDELFFFTTKGQHKYCEIEYPDNCYIIFGKETAGLPEWLLHENPDRCVRLPMLKNLRSLNLSNTVAVGAFEVLRQWEFEGLETEGKLTKYEW